ncbi:MAG: Sec-independent protein translocase protein TatB [Gammaproteobacteria bacterium]|nr:Sec-independent protein translocase protein TatB [Gammaproteobacteria bacterium]
MFDIGFPELLLSALVGLLVIGPERLPEALRTLGLWLGRMRRSFYSVKAEIEKEIGMDEVRKQLHNESVMEEMKRIEREVKATTSAAADATRIESIDPAPPQAADARTSEPLQGPPVEADQSPAQPARSDSG